MQLIHIIIVIYFTKLPEMFLIYFLTIIQNVNCFLNCIQTIHQKVLKKIKNPRLALSFTITDMKLKYIYILCCWVNLFHLWCSWTRIFCENWPMSISCFKIILFVTNFVLPSRNKKRKEIQKCKEIFILIICNRCHHYSDVCLLLKAL